MQSMLPSGKDLAELLGNEYHIESLTEHELSVLIEGTKFLHDFFQHSTMFPLAIYYGNVMEMAEHRLQELKAN